MGELNVLANKYKTDKGDLFFEAHGYANVYEKVLPERGAEISMLEIGIRDIHFPGASMKMWDEYFTNPNFKFIGLDIIPCPEYENSRMKTFVVDQNDEKELLKQVWDKTFDVVIDDGSHLHYAQKTSFQTIFPRVKKGGVYVIEDLHVNNGSETIKYIIGLCVPYKLYCNNKLIVIQGV